MSRSPSPIPLSSADKTGNLDCILRKEDCSVEDLFVQHDNFVVKSVTLLDLVGFSPTSVKSYEEHCRKPIVTLLRPSVQVGDPSGT